MKKSKGMTRQGVRDLSCLGPIRSQGRRLAELPQAVMCKHERRRFISEGYFEQCLICGEIFEVW
jgi:hypothetical protein